MKDAEPLGFEVMLVLAISVWRARDGKDRELPYTPEEMSPTKLFMPITLCHKQDPGEVFLPNIPITHSKTIDSQSPP